MYIKVKDKFQDAMKNASFFTYLILSITFVYFCSPSNVGERQIRTLIYLLGINFGKLVVSLIFSYFFKQKPKTHLQIAHVSNSKFNQFRRTTFFVFTSLNINTFSGYIYGYVIVYSLIYFFFSQEPH